MGSVAYVNFNSYILKTIFNTARVNIFGLCLFLLFLRLVLWINSMFNVQRDATIWIKVTDIMAEWLSHLIRIWEILSLILDPSTDCPDWR